MRMQQRLQLTLTHQVDLQGYNGTNGINGINGTSGVCPAFRLPAYSLVNALPVDILQSLCLGSQSTAAWECRVRWLPSLHQLPIDNLGKCRPQRANKCGWLCLIAPASMPSLRNAARAIRKCCNCPNGERCATLYGPYNRHLSS